VVAFDDAAARAAIVSDVNGVTVAPNDSAGFVVAAARITQNRAGLRAMGMPARRAAEGMSWEGVLGYVEEWLQEVVRRRSIEGANESVAGAAE
jgi:hypothetical protein